MTLITNQERDSEKFHTNPPPRTNAQINPHEMKRTWV